MRGPGSSVVRQVRQYCALYPAEDAGKSLDSKERSVVVPPLVLAGLIDSVREDAEMSPDTQRRIREFLKRQINAETLGGERHPAMEHATVGSPPTSPRSVGITNPAAAWSRPALIALVGGLLTGGIGGGHRGRGGRSNSLCARCPLCLGGQF